MQQHFTDIQEKAKAMLRESRHMSPWSYLKNKTEKGNIQIFISSVYLCF